MHTSTVTVSTLPVRVDRASTTALRGAVAFKFCRGSGAGGQHRNTTDSAVIATHKPTGLSVRCEGERSQHRNKELALQLLSAKLSQAASLASQDSRNAKRKAQVGSGMRGDKRRTVALQRGTVVDHVLKKKMRSKEYLKGNLESLYRS